MIKCPFCYSNHVLNTIFCDECGQFLLEDEATSTEKFPISDEDLFSLKWRKPEPTLPEATTSRQTSAPENTLHESAAVCLRIGPNKQPIQLSLNTPIYIGRLDPGHDIFPDIDLTRYDVDAKAVSRRHVRLFLKDRTLMIEDLDSLNGTYLNGERLPPFLSVGVANGDCLKLSTLELEISFLGSAACSKAVS